VNGVSRPLSASLLLIALITCWTVAPAKAHQPRPAIVTLTLGWSEAELAIRLDLEGTIAGLAVAETTEATSHYKWLRAMEPSELRREVERSAADFLSGFTINFDGVRAPLRLVAAEIPKGEDPALPRISTLRIALSVPVGARSVGWMGPAAAGDTVLRITAIPEQRVLFAGLLQQGQPSPAVEIGRAETRHLGFGHYVIFGFEHIVPEGLDHILFVTGLFLLNARLRPLMWQVSAFTVAHSITLALGLYGIVRIPSEVVEPLIAASIVFVAVENLTTDRLHRWRPAVIFVFGLVHGLGFSGVLQEIGLPQADFLSALFGFNIGVELGQLAVLGGCFLAVGLWFRQREWYRRVVTNPASLAIALIGAYWFVERVT